MTDFSMASEMMLRISFGTAGLIFAVVLLALQTILGLRQKNNNLSFRKALLMVIIGDAVSIVDVMVRVYGFPFSFRIHPAVSYFLLICVFVVNMLLTYYISLYIETFFEDIIASKRILRIINRSVLICGLAVAATEYIYLSVSSDGNFGIAEVSFGVRLFIAYIVEIYFLLYCLILIIKYGLTLSRRAFYTAISAFTVVIGGIFLEFFNPTGILFNYFGAVIGMYIFYIGVEIPDYKNLLQSMSDLSEEKERADKANRAKSEFLANMSHEIRTPINAVLGMNEMVLHKSTDEDVLEYAANIRSAGRTLLSLINDILDFSKIEDGKMVIVPAKYEMASLINDLINTVKQRIDAKGLELNINIDESIPSILYGDDVRIRQVIMNILSNAVKYTQEGSITFTIENRSPEHGDCVLFVSVADTGIGIKDEDKERLFESFVRLDESKNRHIEGTGLGMSIITNLLGIMGSRLEIESKYGEGSTFSFILEQKVIDSTPIGDYTRRHMNIKSGTVTDGRKSYSDARILVVDDNDMNLKVADNLLGLCDIKPDLVSSGMEAVDMIRDRHYDIVFMDHMMPQMDGVETLAKLNEEGVLADDTIVVMLTANAIVGANEEYMAAGFDAYLTKPIEIAKLQDILDRFLVMRSSQETGTAADGAAPDDDPGTVTDIDAVVNELDRQGFDIGAALAFCAGDKDLYVELLRDYVNENIDREKELDSLIRTGDSKGFETSVHALKSIAKMLGATELSDKAFELEQAAGKKDMEYVRCSFPEFKECYKTTIEEIKRVLGDIL